MQNVADAGSDIAKALFAYEPTDESELALAVDDVVEVLSRDESGWWEGRHTTTGEVGYFPANYVEVMKQSTSKEPLSTANVQVSIPESSGVGSSAIAPASKALTKPAVSRAVQQKTGFEDFVSSFTRYGMWATNMAIGSGWALFWTGMASFILSVIDGDGFDPNGSELLLSLYAMVIGLGTVLFEYRWFMRTPTGIPLRSMAYTAVCAPLVFTHLSRFVIIFYGCVAIVNAISAFYNEQYIQEGYFDEPAKPTLSRRSRILGYLRMQGRENNLGALVFLILYTLINIILAVLSYIKWSAIVSSLMGTRLALTEWAPFAKVFGYLLDFNCGMILLPVCRTFIRYLYDFSTQSQTLGQRMLRMALEIVPLHKALLLHKRISMIILVCAFGHTFFHLVNYGLSPVNTLLVFGIWPWISGVLIFAVMLFMYGAVLPNVKHHHFEVFWNTHQMFWVFFILLLTHGKGGINPNVWKWIAAPMVIYLAERVYRRYSAYRSVAITSVNNMGKVLCITFDRDTAFPQGYKEGQYLFLNCPHVSDGQWHPFTISSAPQERDISVHMRLMGDRSWTNDVSEYLKLMMPQNASYANFTNANSKGKILGPDGLQIMRVYGPHSAPTQHVSEYSVDIIIGAGIGVTPVSATIRSIVHHRWKFSIGKSFPDHAYFVWVASHAELDSFRWFVRILKDADDAVYNACAKSSEFMTGKSFEVHIYITSAPKVPVQYVLPKNIDDIAFWGTHQEGEKANVTKVAAPWTEEQLLKVLKSPPSDGVKIGHIWVYGGRPRWETRFEGFSASHQGENIGVAFCGNPRIGKDLKLVCTKFSGPTNHGTKFNLFRENF